MGNYACTHKLHCIIKFKLRDVVCVETGLLPPPLAPLFEATNRGNCLMLHARACERVTCQREQDRALMGCLFRHSKPSSLDPRAHLLSLSRAAVTSHAALIYHVPLNAPRP